MKNNLDTDLIVCEFVQFEFYTVFNIFSVISRRLVTLSRSPGNQTSTESQTHYDAYATPFKTIVEQAKLAQDYQFLFLPQCIKLHSMILISFIPICVHSRLVHMCCKLETVTYIHWETSLRKTDPLDNLQTLHMQISLKLSHTFNYPRTLDNTTTNSTQGAIILLQTALTVKSSGPRWPLIEHLNRIVANLLL